MGGSEPIAGLVSIVMPAYNAERYLDEAVESVLAQTYPNWELLLVNDASSDNTSAKASAWQERDSRIKVTDLEVNGGVAAARNRALEQARGQYIAFLDSDDSWDAEKLAKQLQFMTDTETRVCYTNYRRIDETGEILGRVQAPIQVSYRALLKSNFIGNLTGIYDAANLGKQFLTDFGHEDYVAWLELLKKAGIARGLPLELASYRVYAGSISANKFRAVSWQWRIYRESQNLGWCSAMWYMICYFYYAGKKRSG